MSTLSPWHRGRHRVRVYRQTDVGLPKHPHEALTEFECDVCLYPIAYLVSSERGWNWINTCDAHWSAVERLVVLDRIARTLPRVTA